MGERPDGRRPLRVEMAVVLLALASVGTLAVLASTAVCYAVASVVVVLVGPFVPVLTLPTPLGPIGAVLLTLPFEMLVLDRARGDALLSDVPTAPAGETSLPPGVDAAGLGATITRLAATFDVPAPELLVADTDRPLALATGVRAAETRLVLSRGLLARLDDAERAAVVAHELAHVRNGDARVMTLAAIPVAAATHVLGVVETTEDREPVEPPTGTLREAAWVAGIAAALLVPGVAGVLWLNGWIALVSGLLVLLGQAFALTGLAMVLPLRAGDERGFEHDGLSDVLFVLAIAAALAFDATLALGHGVGALALLFGALAALACCIAAVILLTYLPWGLWVGTKGLEAALGRRREFVADRAAALATGDPAALATALRTLDGRARPTADFRTAAVEPLSIVPLLDTPPTWGRYPDLQRRLFRSHPATDERIARLRAVERELETR